MRVIATKQGYHGCFREQGDVFDVPEGSKATWFTPAPSQGGQPAKPSQPVKINQPSKGNAKGSKKDEPETVEDEAEDEKLV